MKFKKFLAIYLIIFVLLVSFVVMMSIVILTHTFLANGEHIKGLITALISLFALPFFVALNETLFKD